MTSNLGPLIQRYELSGIAKLTKLGSAPSVELCEQGVIHRAGKHISTLRWDDIKQLRVQVDDLAAQRMDGSTFAFRNTFGDDFEAMVPAILEQAGHVLAQPDLARLASGETISYGRFAIDAASKVLHLPYGDEITLVGLEVRVPLIEQRFVIFDEQAGKAFDQAAAQTPDSEEDEDFLFARPKWFRPHSFSDIQPFPRFLAVLANLDVPVHLVGTRRAKDGSTSTYQHEWKR